MCNCDDQIILNSYLSPQFNVWSFIYSLDFSLYFFLKGMLAGRIIFSMVFAKVSITIAFDLAYVYSAELFPTVMRSDDNFHSFYPLLYNMTWHVFFFCQLLLWINIIKRIFESYKWRQVIVSFVWINIFYLKLDRP